MAVVESEGNGRMCLTLPRTMITLAGIEKVLPRFRDLEVMLQLLARSATGERMNPYTSLWTGVTPGDGPQKFHVVLLDNGRSRFWRAEGAADAALHSLRGLHERLPGLPADRRACLRVGVSGADRRDSDAAAEQMHHAQSLPFASSLCGACYDVCPVKINIPEVLLELRSRVVDQERGQLRRVL